MINNKITVNYTVLSLWLAKELQNRGFECIGTADNTYKTGFKVFYFEDTDELREEIRNIKKEKYQNEKLQYNNLPKPGKFYHRQES